ncbi:DUF6798 domain-containing protein [Nostoc sp. MS1]|uniref:DUF6798 domain-containing protein n=1 Tax=Nostoc sp. MS1 TaxID=2764711 RepID=UPI001CC7B2AB|nr:DUF6798 domain-containing protein [Nostoc sp. MS1]
MSQQNLQKPRYGENLIGLGSKKSWYRQSLLPIGLSTIIVLTFLCLRLLLGDNMSAWNEVDVLPLAKQYVEPTWIPGDWYLNQSPSYRVLFQSLFGRLIVSWGFLTTSIVGRLICYGLVAWGLVLIARQIGLHLVALLLALPLFLTDNQGAIAGEWLVGGFETKAVAYGLVMLAIALLLKRRYSLMALLLGLATSFHVLVGGYTFLTAIGWFCVRYKTRFPRMKEWGWMLLMYFTGSIFVLPAVIQQLLTPKPTGNLASSYIYVFLRLPHHLNPQHWYKVWWLMLIGYLLILPISVAFICLYRPSKERSTQRNACIELLEFTLISLIPFVLGLAIAPFDSQGRFLQYYPFRLGDIMLPLFTCLLFTRAVQHFFTVKTKQKEFFIICCLLLSINVVSLSLPLPTHINYVKQFPSKLTEETPESQDIYAWVKNNTAKDATVISSPVDLLNFTWLAERPIIAKWKFLPQTASGIQEWYARICDLVGVDKLTSTSPETLTEAYERLTTDQVKALMVKYKSPYIVTKVQHQLNLPVAYRNQSYVIYKQSDRV